LIDIYPRGWTILGGFVFVRRSPIFTSKHKGMQSNQILNANQIRQKIRRMAYHIHENHYQERDLILAGIQDSGYQLAEFIQAELERISPLQVSCLRLVLDKQAHIQPSVSIHGEWPELNNKVVILVDDVLNSGRTLAFAMKPFLEQAIKKLEVAVLVNRAHKRYPVSVDYTGYELATTLNEHIQVNLKEVEMAVHLL